MDLNLVVLCGRLAAVPEMREFDSGTRLMRFLVTVRSEEPRARLDVVPVTLWDPDEGVVGEPFEPGARVWVAGAVQRRFWEGAAGRRSMIEVVASQVTLRPAEQLQNARSGGG